jgi:chorismate synthase
MGKEGGREVTDFWKRRADTLASLIIAIAAVKAIEWGLQATGCHGAETTEKIANLALFLALFAYLKGVK